MLALRNVASTMLYGEPGTRGWNNNVWKQIQHDIDPPDYLNSSMFRWNIYVGVTSLKKPQCKFYSLWDSFSSTSISGNSIQLRILGDVYNIIYMFCISRHIETLYICNKLVSQNIYPPFQQHVHELFAQDPWSLYFSIIDRGYWAEICLNRYVLVCSI